MLQVESGGISSLQNTAFIRHNRTLRPHHENVYVDLKKTLVVLSSWKPQVKCWRAELDKLTVK